MQPPPTEILNPKIISGYAHGYGYKVLVTSFSQSSPSQCHPLTNSLWSLVSALVIARSACRAEIPI